MEEQEEKELMLVVGKVWKYMEEVGGGVAETGDAH